MTGREIISESEFYKLIEVSMEELKGIMDVTLKQRAKDAVKSALGRSVRTKDPMFWPAGMLMLGLVEARALLKEGLSFGDEGATLIKKIDSSIEEHLNLWKDKYNGRIDYIDDALSGAALVKLYAATDDEALKDKCRKAAGDIYAYLLNAPRDREGTIVYNADRSSSNVFSDGVGQTSLFLAAYGKTFEDIKALELSALLLLNFKKFGMDEKSSLPYHGYALMDGECEKKGVLSWGRAAGWLLMGLSEYFSATAHGSISFGGSGLDLETSKELAGWYDRLSDTIIEYRRPKGGYSWQVQAMEGHIDISATGMLLYGLYNGRDKDTSAGVQDALKPSLEAVVSNISDGRALNALSSCDDFGVHYQTYGHYPWGQGAALMAVSKAIHAGSRETL